MMDSNGARVLVQRYHRDRDERLLHTIGKVLQALHDDQCPRSPGRLAAEVMLLSELIDCYENLGRFTDADGVKLTRAMVQHELTLATGGIRVIEMREVA